jgi:hypothetical protein
VRLISTSGNHVNHIRTGALGEQHRLISRSGGFMVAKLYAYNYRSNQLFALEKPTLW